MERKKEIIKGEIKKEALVGNDEDKERMLIQVKEELDKEKARERSIKEGSFAAVAQGAAHNYMSAFAIALGSTNSQIGLLSTLPNILRPASQLIGSRKMEKLPRKKIVVKYVFLEALFWLSFVALSLFVYFYDGLNYGWTIIFLYSLLIFVGNLAAPAWFSWMGDIVSEKHRGRYFAKRNRIAGTITLIAMLAASFFLDFFKTRGILLIAFAILFLIASIARGVSSLMFTKQYDPEFKLEEGYYFSFFSFIKNLPKTNFGRFTIFVALLSFAQFIAAPFFAPYMLRELGFSYLWFTLVTISTSIFTLISLPLWGRLSDKYGSKFIITVGAVLIPLLPILWLASPNPFYLIFVPGFIGGLGWGAFNLGAGNYIYDAVSPQRRGIAIAYYNLIVSIGILLGGFLGSFLVKFQFFEGLSSILFVFFISGILRAGVVAYMLPYFREIKETRKPREIASAVLGEIKPIHINFSTILYEPSWLRHLFRKERITKKSN